MSAGAVVIWIWIASAVFGGVFALIARRNAQEELDNLGDITNGRRRLGNGHVRDETILFVIDALYLAMGLLFVATGREPTFNVTVLGLTLCSVLLSYSTFMRWVDRRYALAPDPSRDPSVAETQNQREDREFGEQRRDLETKHNEQ